MRGVIQTMRERERVHDEYSGSGREMSEGVVSERKVEWKSKRCSKESESET